MPAGRLPGTEHEERSIILHVDMDAFYAACERLQNPELEGKPVVVGMGYEPGETIGAVATASYEAREHGVESAQPISKALDLLPRTARNPDTEPVGYYRPVDLEFYEDVSADVKAILHELADAVREVSIDEAYLDVTDRTAWEVAEGFGRHVKQRIAREVGVPASVGVAPNMSAAKIASDHDKPDGLTVVPPAELREFLDPLPIEDLHGVGPKSASTFHEMGIDTIGDLAAADLETITDQFGERGRELHLRARGIDEREVEARGRPKSLSRESSFSQPTADIERARARIDELAGAVATRATEKGALYRTIGIKVIEPPYELHTRERSLSGPVDEPPLVAETAQTLFDEFEGKSVRKLGVRVSNLSFADNDQADLASWTDRTAHESGDSSTEIRGQARIESFDRSEPTE
ncbi:DNA polymerase IV [Halodesulfurarchaeum formicicum]|uniref:DNA polymerase IV n=1 Tax=Halodesulfurarchaeum formicicum TaxID=1873524 RepID=A0A1J1ACC8_9EURY|nr:DNA polymerase IV [Halodesulfurarchaeum formicicum]APE95383.1 DNA polymerase IV [Halodesulfurarchaeum formicicum]